MNFSRSILAPSFPGTLDPPTNTPLPRDVDMPMIEQFSAQLSQKGIPLVQTGTDLKVYAPGAMTAELAGDIRQRKQEITSFLSQLPAKQQPISPAPKDSPPAISFTQQRTWFLDQLPHQQGESTGTYNVYSTTRLAGALNIDTLQQALTHLEQRHEILRTNFETVQGKSVTVIRSEPTLKLKVHQRASMTEHQVLAEIAMLCQQGFSLSDEPLLLLDLMRLSPTSLQKGLARIWFDVLGKDPIGLDDHFFEIGGHSLLPTQVLARMHQAFPERLSLQYLFEKPTIADISEGIANIRKSLDSEDPPDDEFREDFEFLKYARTHYMNLYSFFLIHSIIHSIYTKCCPFFDFQWSFLGSGEKSFHAPLSHSPLKWEPIGHLWEASISL